ncbi:MAG: hypothetical protein ACSLE8_05670 [Rhodococcus sp. (in: high G+C Gram-positive bacteria)]
MSREAARQATEGIWLNPPSDSRTYLWTDEVLRSFAEEAVRVQYRIAGGESLSTRREMADWLRRHIKASATEATVREVMKKARARGFLAPSRHGSRDVHPGPKLLLVPELAAPSAPAPGEPAESPSKRTPKKREQEK